jgi:hypothetical protein
VDDHPEQHAFNLNIELGIIVRGGDLPARVAAQWSSMMTAHILRRISAEG